MHRSIGRLREFQLKESNFPRILKFLTYLCNDICHFVCRIRPAQTQCRQYYEQKGLHQFSVQFELSYRRISRFFRFPNIFSEKFPWTSTCLIVERYSTVSRIIVMRIRLQTKVESIIRRFKFTCLKIHKSRKHGLSKPWHFSNPPSLQCWVRIFRRLSKTHALRLLLL